MTLVKLEELEERDKRWLTRRGFLLGAAGLVGASMVVPWERRLHALGALDEATSLEVFSGFYIPGLGVSGLSAEWNRHLKELYETNVASRLVYSSNPLQSIPFKIEYRLDKGEG